MSGHSKWHNIHRDKAKADTRRSLVFAKIGVEITAAVRSGGSDPAANAHLKELISKAKALNVPMDNIRRVIQRAEGQSGGAGFESITYEGYGPEGVAIIAQALTDNRNRTAADVRHCFEKYGCSLGSPGCVSWSFDRRGVLIMDGEGRDEDEMMMLALDKGASDFQAYDGIFEIRTDPEDFSPVLQALQDSGCSFESAQIELIPQALQSVTHPRRKSSVQKLICELEENEDIQSVWHNWDGEI